MATFLCAILQAKQSSSIFVHVVCYETFAQCVKVCVCLQVQAAESGIAVVPSSVQWAACPQGEPINCLWDRPPLSSGGIDPAS